MSGNASFGSTKAAHVNIAVFPGCTFRSWGGDRITVLSGGGSTETHRAEASGQRLHGDDRGTCGPLTEHFQLGVD